MNRECCDKLHWNKAEGRFDTRQRLKGEEKANLWRGISSISQSFAGLSSLVRYQREIQLLRAPMYNSLCLSALAMVEWMKERKKALKRCVLQISNSHVLDLYVYKAIEQ